MTDKEYQGVITSVQPTSASVKLQIDTVAGKMFVWPMAAFVSKPRPEVGKWFVCTARPGPHDELHVQQLISITDAPKQAVPTEISPDPTPLPLPSDAATLERLAERILELKAKCKDTLAHSLLDFKWNVGREIFVVRGGQEPETFRDLEKRTGIDFRDLARCVQFYEKYPKQDYELKAWRELRAELPAGKELAKEPKDKSADGKAFKDAEALGRERGYQTIRCPHCAEPLWLDWKGGQLHNPLAEKENLKAD
jgi:hypothetical protein